MAPKLLEFLSNLKRGTAAFQLKFKDRVGAGQALGIALNLSVKRKKGEKNKDSLLVIGIPRGGVIVADIVAKKLDADFDLIISKKLRAPDNKENAIGAVLFNGYTYLDEVKVKFLKVSPDYIEKEKMEQIREIQSKKTNAFRPMSREYRIKGRTVVLVDDWISTGSTLIAAARWIRKQNPSQLIIAAPVAQAEVIESLNKEADEIEIILTPPNFVSVAQFYQDFDQATDEKVIEVLRSRNLA